LSPLKPRESPSPILTNKSMSGPVYVALRFPLSVEVTQHGTRASRPRRLVPGWYTSSVTLNETSSSSKFSWQPCGVQQLIFTRGEIKRKPLSTSKRLLLSSGIGIAFVLLLFSLSSGSEGDSNSLFFVFLWPGAFLADWAWYGGHDLEGLLLFILGNMAFYVLIAFFILWLVEARRLARNR